MEPRRSQRIKISNEGGALGALSRHLPVVFESEVLRHLDVDDLVSLSRVNKECRRAASNASKLARADHYDARCAECNNKALCSIDPAIVHPVFRALMRCHAQRSAEEAEKLRAEVANDRRQSPLSSSSGEFYYFPRRENMASRLQNAAVMMLEPRPGT